MATTIGGVLIRIGASTTELEKSLKRAEKSLKQTADKFANLGQSLTLGVTLPVVAAGAAAFKMASDYEESLNKVRVAFGNSSASVEAFAKSAIENIGLAEQSALDMAALFGDMATSMGLPQDEAAKLSISLTQLAGDLASFKNISIEEVKTALAGVFTGETESLKRLGINMLEVNLEAFALSQGITKKMKVMTQAEKVSLRYAYIMSVTKNAQGDFARTAGGAANKMRTFQESIKELGQQFGKVLLPLLTPIISKVTDFIKKIGSLDDATKRTIATVALLSATLGPLFSIYSQGVKIYGDIAAASARLVAVWIEQAAAQAALKGGLPLLTAQTVTFATTLKATLVTIAPYAAAIAAIGIAIFALYKNYKSKNQEQQKALTLDEQAIENTEKERTRVQGLIGVIKAETSSKKDRAKAIEELKSISPEYFGNLNAENINIQALTKSYTKYNEQLIASAKGIAARDKLVKIQNELIDIEKQQFENSVKNATALETQRKKESELFAVGYTPAQVEQFQKSNKTIQKGLEANLEARRIALEKEQEYYLKFAAPPETPKGLAAIAPGGEESDFSNELKKLQTDFDNVAKLLDAGIITKFEATEQRIDILTEKLKLLATNGFAPNSKEITDVKNQIESLDGSIDIFRKLDDAIFLDSTDEQIDRYQNLQFELLKLQGAFNNGVVKPVEFAEQSIALLNEELKKLSDEGFDQTSTQVQKLQSELNKFKTYEIDLKGREVLTELSKEIDLINKKSESGLITFDDATADRVTATKNAMDQLIALGLQGTPIFQQLQNSLQNITPPKQQFTDFFSYIGNSIANMPGVIAKFGAQFGDGLKTAIAKAAEGIANVVNQAFGVVQQYYEFQEQKIDQFEAKEKARIEQTITNEEDKAAALDALEEKVLKKRKELARKKAVADKAQALFSATIAGATAVINALSVPLIGAALAKITAGLVAAQLALIAAAPLPSLAIGTNMVKSDGLAMIHRGEQIVPADVVKGGYTGSGNELYSRISGIDLILSNKKTERYLSKIG